VTHAALVPVMLAADARSVRIIDQRRLPAEFVERELHMVDDVIDAIQTLAVRGAPAIGIAGAAAMAIAAQDYTMVDARTALVNLRLIGTRVAAARPTAVNLRWAVDRVLMTAARVTSDGAAVAAAIAADAQAIRDEDLAMSAAIGTHALALLPDPAVVMTHCNAGGLATAGLGTALAPVYAAHAAGRGISVVADETRPLLQGARLTAWELHRAGVPVTVITDAMGAAYMATHAVDAVFVGADRIAANGDTANKIGTYALALAARAHGVPFYVLAPWSTIDADTPSGEHIVIEHRGADEVTHVAGTRTVPDGVAVWNPAFDVTPAALITAIITDRGVHRSPFAVGPA
jgi:methylthioribose-1-phosphate isomerase